jgi:predicted lipoprotein
MTRRFLLSIGALVVAVALGIGGFFFFRRASVREYFRGREAKAVMSDYVDNAVLKTLALFSADAETLRTASKALQATPNAGNLEAAVRAWRAAHRTWMQTVAYRYGPAAQYDYHKRIATWPVDKVLVEHSLTLLGAGSLKVDAGALRRAVSVVPRRKAPRGREPSPHGASLPFRRRRRLADRQPRF